MEAKEKLKRELRREAITRIEDAARTEAEFANVTVEWNRLDENRERNIRRREVQSNQELQNFAISQETIIPQPLDSIWWRQLIRGDFIDVIFDCPYEIHELTSSRSVSAFVKALNDNQKEVLYFKAIRLYSFQRIAAMRGQTDRNVLKVYTTLMNGLRRKLFERLCPRYVNHQPLTFAQREFVAWYLEQSKGKEKPAINGGGNK